MEASLIIPAYNNAEYLENTLKSVALQGEALERLEVIVVDDGSREPLEELVDCGGMKVMFLREPHGGRARARNAGIREAGGEILIFMDSDMLMGPSFIRKHIQHHRREAADVVLGNVRHIPAKHKESIFLKIRQGGIQYDALAQLTGDDQYLSIAREVFSNPTSRALVPWLCCFFSNCSVKKRVFEKSGLFDTGFEGWGLEDIELGYRFYKCGCGYYWDEQLHAYHIDHGSENADQMISEMVRNVKYFHSKYQSPVTKHYISFVAGFISLNDYIERVGGQRPASAPGDAIYFKPLAYSKAKR